MSYQANTFTILSPMTLVEIPSMIAEKASPLKSIDTRGFSSNRIILFKGPWEASLNASLTSSAVVFYSTSTTRSISDTLGVGTRMAIPSSLPLISGKTKATAFAAPVVVGIMERFAALARLRSE